MEDKSLRKVQAVIAGCGVAVIAAVIASRYRVSSANMIISKTGPFIKNIAIGKKTFILPFQKFNYISLEPKHIDVSLTAMSSEKLEFKIPCSFTVAVSDVHSDIEKYALRLVGCNEGKIIEILFGMIEGEARVLASKMKIEDIFNDRAKFRDMVITNVEQDLKDKLGLKILNANIKELADMDGSEYFRYMRQKTTKGAENQAKIDISEAQKNGTIGEKERITTTRINIAGLEAKSVLFENEQDVTKANSEKLKKINLIEFDRETRIKQIEADAFTEKRKQELQEIVQLAKAKCNLESLRAEQLMKIQLEKESAIMKAEGIKRSMMLEADGELYKKQLQAEAILKMYKAEADGLKLIEGSVKEPGALEYFRLKNNLYQDLAKQNSAAIQGLNPKITVWNTGSGDRNPLTDIFKNIPPLLQTVYDQSGVKPPSWMIDIGDKVNKTNETGKK